MHPEANVVDFAAFTREKGFELAPWQLAICEEILSGRPLEFNWNRPRRDYHGEATMRALARLWNEVKAA